MPRQAIRMLVVLAVCAGASACGSARCEWPHEAAVPVDLTDDIQRRHLRDDAYGARAFAVRYADASVILPSGPEATDWNERVAVHREASSRCEASLAAAIAANHHVTTAQVRALVSE